ncbi:uncharacterized protein F4822DRAFT_444690 [Hypoxylon trugodes]|uniref:uncharacterized protein n=1 Tax=Hypoxylon trugodes TaxID=326681 RepID=UPI00219866DB|nr:uncharacterized protein F4822DRAFT_444690 [Hypoxylon trugodes]KAI1386202.1 hypothetical protein F4822DRAFT_444690 [Hypoxylon trugodes]
MAPPPPEPYTSASRPTYSPRPRAAPWPPQEQYFPEQSTGYYPPRYYSNQRSPPPTPRRTPLYRVVTPGVPFQETFEELPPMAYPPQPSRGRDNPFDPNSRYSPYASWVPLRPAPVPSPAFARPTYEVYETPEPEGRRTPPHQLPPEPAAPRALTPILPVDLFERPEALTFRTREDLQTRLVSTFRPLVGVLGGIVKRHLNLKNQPKVKFDMYPILLNDTRPILAKRSQTWDRGPIFQFTIPRSRMRPQTLQDVSDALKDEAYNHANPWYRQAGFVFRVSTRGGNRREGPLRRIRYWVPPATIYAFVRRAGYRAEQVVPIREDLEELEYRQDFGDTSEDDQDALVDDMWDSVRNNNQGFPGGSS